jgi:hypothetical protein
VEAGRRDAGPQPRGENDGEPTALEQRTGTREARVAAHESIDRGASDRTSERERGHASRDGAEERHRGAAERPEREAPGGRQDTAGEHRRGERDPGRDSDRRRSRAEPEEQLAHSGGRVQEPDRCHDNSHDHHGGQTDEPAGRHGSSLVALRLTYRSTGAGYQMTADSQPKTVNAGDAGAPRPDVRSPPCSDQPKGAQT